MKPDGGWLGRTSQRWKVVPGIIALVVSGTCLIGLVFCSANPEVAFAGMENDEVITIIALMLGLFGSFAFTWFMFAFRCPACGTSASKSLIAGKQSSRWFSMLLVLEACPVCGDDASKSKN